MNKDRMKEVDLAYVVDELAEDVFDCDIEVVEQELVEAGEVPDQVATRMRALIGKVLLQNARIHLDANKEIGNLKVTDSNVVAFAPGVARAKLANIVGRDPAAHPELTMAARKGAFLSDADAESQLQDLMELGVISRDELE